MSEQPVNPNRGTATEDLEPPEENVVKRLQQLIGVAWTDWDEPEMKAPALAFLDTIEASTANEQRSKSEAQQLITDSWGNGDQLDELSNLLAAWAEGNFHASAFNPAAPVESASADSGDADSIRINPVLVSVVPDKSNSAVNVFDNLHDRRLRLRNVIDRKDRVTATKQGCHHPHR